MDPLVRPEAAKLCGFAEQLNPWFRRPSDNNANDVYVGAVRLPGLTQPANAYVKIFPVSDRFQFVYNEVIAYHLALQCALPSPCTFPCVCPTSFLRPATRAFMAPDPSSRFVLGVASLDGTPKNIKQTISTSDAAWADLMNWPNVARLAVFDELMANDDRHLNNLIRRGPHDYLVIDNERILFGEHWFNRDLKPLQRRRCDANVLADTISETTDQDIRQRMMRIAQHFVMTTLLTVPEIADNLERLCGAPPGTTARLIEMLNDRRTFLPTLMQWHAQKGDMFRASTHR